MGAGFPMMAWGVALVATQEEMEHAGVRGKTKR